MSPHGCPKMSAKLCNRNAEESFPVLSLKSWEQKPPNPLLIQDKNVLQPSTDLFHARVDIRFACDHLRRFIERFGAGQLVVGPSRAARKAKEYHITYAPYLWNTLDESVAA